MKRALAGLGMLVVIVALHSAPVASATTLTHLTTHTEGVSGITGLTAPRELRVSPDGAFVYVRNVGDVLSVFSRDGGTGALTSVTSYTLGVDLPLPTGGWSGWEISPDGLSIFVWSAGELVILTRDLGTGAASYLETHSVIVRLVAVNPSSDSVYVAGNDQLDVFDRDVGTGSLTHIQTFNASKFFPRSIYANDAYVYATTPGWRTHRVFERDAATGELTLIQKLNAGWNPHCSFGDFNCEVEGRDMLGLFPSLSGAHLYVGGEHGTTGPDHLLDTYIVAPDGKLTQVDRQFMHLCYDPPPSTIRLVALPDGLRMIGDEAVYSLDPTTGDIRLLETFDAAALAGLTDPWRKAVSPDGLHYYLAGEDDESVAVFSIGASPTTPVTAECRYWGLNLVIRNAGPSGLLTSIKWKAAGPIAAPVVGSANDPRCNGDPSGTVKASVRFASSASGEDTGDLPLPCEHWSAAGNPESQGRIFKYLDKNKTSGPCKKIQLKGKKIISAVCDNKGPSPLSYLLTQGLSEEDVDAVLTIGDIRYCTQYDPHNGADGSDGKKYQGKKDFRASSCPTF